jgi:DNA-binding MarR family transcriptional regulator
MFELYDSLSFLLAKCNQKAFALSQERLSEYNLTPEQAVALTYLFKKDGINQLQLGEMIQKDRTTISGILNKLEASGYIRKGVNPSDKRSSLIYVTEKALKIKDALLEQAVEVNKFLTKDLTDQEREWLIAFLKKIRNN